MIGKNVNFSVVKNEVSYCIRGRYVLFLKVIM